MRKSEIFDSFVKIAQEKGLVSKDAPEKAQKILEKTRRADSLSLEDIAKLYGVKPDAPVEMQYVRNIIENAHKTPLVISPSYDKLMGLIENENERQDISLHILQKVPDGLITQHKYAKQDLVMSLVRVGNDLDNHNEEKLCVLADFCLQQLTEKNMKKRGQLALVGVAAAVLGTLYWQQHSNTWSQGFVKDSRALVEEIKDLATSGSNVMVYGYKYRPEFVAQMKDFQQKVANLYNLYGSEVVPALNDIEKPRTAKELFEVAKSPSTQAALKAHADFANYAANLLPYLEQIHSEFSDENFKQRQIEDEGIVSNLLDKTQILHGGKGMIRDDFDDVKDRIPAYIDDVTKIIDSLKQAEQFKNTVLTSLRESAAQATQWQAPAQEAAPATPVASPEEGIASGLSDLEKQLEGSGLE